MESIKHETSSYEDTKRGTFGGIRVAAVQAESVFLDLERTTNKACKLIEEAAEKGADLIAFPECFVPSFPNWYELHGENNLTRNLDKELFKHSVEMNGQHIQKIAEACSKGNINAVLGINERIAGTTGTMYNTQVYIQRDGTIAGKHQKYVPTTGERFIHAPGNTGYYNAYKTNFGTVSGLICGENSNPLGQYAAATSHPVVHVASWPAFFGPIMPMHHAIESASAGLAYSLKCFVVSAVARISDDLIEAIGIDDTSRDYLKEQQSLKKGAVIFDPIGRIIAHGDGNESDLLFADINLEDCIIPKLIQDFAGHYNRPEVFAPLFSKHVETLV
ncbi:carbon-nitrogen hydrolase family protein [Bacillus sp. LJBS17]|uniref:carbon-nitrogen hydrolase family protein n=1 Tax=Bacillus sp. LJBS17 TaxID=2859227 RepID=UPI001C5A4886|nr:carbon-nitrogen hydrolase family protein [Bacillus sp. LJBS17]QXW84086.1 carbon-nitrogen hydrolase family protein [Bacillus sp. LJBS17]